MTLPSFRLERSPVHTGEKSLNIFIVPNGDLNPKISPLRSK
jgi:hypothetical protein